MQAVLNRFIQTIRDASDQKRPLRFRGGGTKDFLGQALIGEVFDTREYAGVVDYDPAELVITARCGTSLAEVEAVLAERHQSLPFEPPHFSSVDSDRRATIGGAFAAGLSGPRRESVGALRDFVLGAQLINGRGAVLNFGGRVMKNVAGYDVSRLLAGSLGTLGLITEVSIKVLPIPMEEATVQLEMEQPEAIAFFNRFSGQPYPICSSVWVDGRVLIRLAGARAAVRATQEKLGGTAVPISVAHGYWKSLREQTHPFFRRDSSAPLWRIAVPSITPPLRLQGTQLVEWGGGQRWWIAPDCTQRTSERVRDLAQQAGGHATLFRNGEKTVGVFTELSPAARAIHKRLKATFDPAGIFCPERMYTDV